MQTSARRIPTCYIHAPRYRPPPPMRTAEAFAPSTGRQQSPSESPGCVDPVWSSQAPADITTVQSFKIDFDSLVLNAEDGVPIGVRMRTPYGGTAAAAVVNL